MMVWGDHIRSFDYHLCKEKIQKQKHPLKKNYGDFGGK